MANLQDILANAQHGDAMDLLARAYGLTPEQTQAAVEALLPAISLGLKRTTATPEGLGALFSVAAQQPQLFAMYEDPGAALSPQGVAAGNAALANMFGSPEASRAVAAHAQQLSGVGGAILKKILPVLVGMILSGLMRGGSGQAAPAPQQPAPRQPMPEPGGGGLFDIFREILQQGGPAAGPASYPQGQGPVPPIGDILDSIGGGQRRSAEAEPPRFPVPEAGPDVSSANPPSQPLPHPPASGGDQTFPGGQDMPGGDVFGQILKELGKAIQEGRVKPVIVGPGGMPFPGQQPSGGGQAQPPGGGAGGNIFGDILKEVLGGALGQGKSGQYGLMDPTGGAGAAVFGEALETGTKIAQHHAETLQQIFDRFGSVPPQAD
ncbi:MAG: DUF937 domain-containing protein [Hyphomicrobiaceae bacterium]|nr:DUF937 domain-containing protein [Hyphomicrobiaceae bacterium]